MHTHTLIHTSTAVGLNPIPLARAQSLAAPLVSQILICANDLLIMWVICAIISLWFSTSPLFSPVYFFSRKIFTAKTLIFAYSNTPLTNETMFYQNSIKRHGRADYPRVSRSRAWQPLATRWQRGCSRERRGRLSFRWAHASRSLLSCVECVCVLCLCESLTLLQFPQEEL